MKQILKLISIAKKYAKISKDLGLVIDEHNYLRSPMSSIKESTFLMRITS